MQPNAEYRRVFRIGVYSVLAGIVCSSPIFVLEILKWFITGVYHPYLFLIVFVITAVSVTGWQFRVWRNEVSE